MLITKKLFDLLGGISLDLARNTHCTRAFPQLEYTVNGALIKHEALKEVHHMGSQRRARQEDQVMIPLAAEETARLARQDELRVQGPELPQARILRE